GARLQRLLFQMHHFVFVVGIKGSNAVALRVLYIVGKDGGAAATLAGALQGLFDIAAVENVVAQQQTDAVLANEVLANKEGLRQTFRLLLLRILEVDAPLRTILQEALE